MLDSILNVFKSDSQRADRGSIKFAMRGKVLGRNNVFKLIEVAC